VSLDSELILSEKLGKISVLALQGLCCDGSHHKQWFLERILEITDGTKAVEEIQDQTGEKGVAP
jgi:hypothetical protein